MRHFILSLVIIPFLFTLFSPAFAETPTMDIDEMADTMRDKVFAIVGSVPDNDPGKPSRKVKIERIIYLPGAVSGSTINITFSDYAAGITAGMYVLLLRRDGETFICGNGTLVLGPINNYLPVKGPSDQEVFDAFMIFDTFRISNTGLKEQRLIDLMTDMANRPIVVQYILDAKKHLSEKSTRDYANTLLSIVYNRDPASYGIDTVIKADMMLNELPPQLTGSWGKTNRRKLLFQSLKDALPADSPAMSYIEKVINSYNNK